MRSTGVENLIKKKVNKLIIIVINRLLFQWEIYRIVIISSLSRRLEDIILLYGHERQGLYRKYAITI